MCEEIISKCMSYTIQNFYKNSEYNETVMYSWSMVVAGKWDVLMQLDKIIDDVFCKGAQFGSLSMVAKVLMGNSVKENIV